LMMWEKRGLTITPTFHKQMKKMWYAHLDIKDIVTKMRRYADKLWNDTYELRLNSNKATAKIEIVYDIVKELDVPAIESE
jgi:hypothetical protein